MRCSRCRHTWHQGPEAPDFDDDGAPDPAAPEPEAEAVAEADAAPPEAPEPADPPAAEESALVDFSGSLDDLESDLDSGLDFDLEDTPEFGPEEGLDDSVEPAGRSWTGWLVLAVTVVGVLAVVIVLRDAITAMWPPAERLYATIGLDITDPAAGLEIREVALTWEADETGAPSLLITAQLLNKSGAVKTPPPVRIDLRDDAQNTLMSTAVAASTLNMVPNELLPFETRLTGIPAEASGAYLSFAPVDETAEATEAAETGSGTEDAATAAE